MSADVRRKSGAIWCAALFTGLLTSTFSTLAVIFGAHRIGRGVALSFMEVGTVLLGYPGVRLEPGWREIIAGIFVHQSADVFWAVVFFGPGARWTWRLRPSALLLVAPFWAAATAAAEYWLILPWLQPLLVMQVPYWVAFGVHLASSAAYPLFYWVRKFVLPGEEAVYSAFGRRAGIALAGVLALVISVEALGESGREPYWPFAGEQARAFDQSFMRKMTVHHEVGIKLAQLAAGKAERDELRMLGRLMVAEQRAEIESQQRWWRSWFGGELPPPTPGEHATMPGMPPAGAVEELANLSGAALERRFLDLMIPHHEGAVQMSDDAWRQAGDPRLRLFADQIRHAQFNQIGRMKVLRRAAAGLLVPEGAGDVNNLPRPG